MNEDSIVEKYYPLVASIAQKYPYLPREDLIQEGMIGLIMAWRRFDPEQGTEFATYAYYYIKKQILSAIEKEQPAAYQTLNENYDAVSKTEPENTPSETHLPDLPESMPEIEKLILRLSFGEELSYKEISQRTGFRVEKIRYLKAKAMRRMKVLQGSGE
jgi:RNA polymerase sigma factor (sigma-70 family)